MNKFKFKKQLFFLKVLKKIKLLSFFNFCVSRQLNERKIIIPIVNGIGFTNYVLNPEWLDLLIRHFVKSNEGAFVDVGMNIGQTLLRLKTIFPDAEYIGFEPNANCVAYVQLLVKKNKLENCMIQNCALSTKVQSLVLEKTLKTDVRASLVSDLRPTFFTDRELVFALDYQSFYLDKKISFVKIDVEGGELEVLFGMKEALQRYQPIITCEILDSHSDEQLEFTQKRATSVSDFLMSIDYRIIRLNTKKDGIVSFSKIDTVKIKQWTNDSYALNDYLFYPENKEIFIIDTLSKIINENKSSKLK